MFLRMPVYLYSSVKSKKWWDSTRLEEERRISSFLFLSNSPYHMLGFLCGSGCEESTRNVGDLGSIPGWKDPMEKGKATPPVFWPGEFHGLDSPWGHKESDTTERLSVH